jgi:hypothetical protein
VKAAILYNKFLDPEGREPLVGGVETYLLNLARVCQETGLGTTIYQWSNRPFARALDGVKVQGVPVGQMPLRKQRMAAFQAVARELDPRRDLLIFGADHASVPTANPRCISIQHGVSWDLPVRYTIQRRLAKYEWATRIKKWRPAQKQGSVAKGPLGVPAGTFSNDQPRLLAWGILLFFQGVSSFTSRPGTAVMVLRGPLDDRISG